MRLPLLVRYLAIVLTMFTFSAGTARAQLTASDDFAYTAGTLLEGQNGGGGWASAWEQNGNVGATVVAGSLSFKGLKTSSNSAAYPTDELAGNPRHLASALGADGTTVYLSFLMKCIDGNDVGKEGKYRGIGFGRLFVGKAGGNFYAIENGGGAGNVPSNVTVVPGQTAFLVVRITFKAGNDTIELFVNPTPGAPLPGTPNAVKTDLDMGEWDTMGPGGDAAWQFDEIRIGPSWEEVSPSIGVSSVSLAPDTVTTGETSTGTVTLTDPAPAGGAVVTLSSSNTAVAGVPASVTVAAGSTSATFTVTTGDVSAQSTANIGATYGGVTQSATLTVKPVGVSSVSVSPASVVGGNGSVGTVTLGKAAPFGGAVVTLTSSNSVAAAPPTSITIPEGSSLGVFNIATAGIALDTDVTISASWNSTTKSTKLTVRAADLTGISLSSASVTGGLQVTATLTLNGAAPSGGRVIGLDSNSAAATIPAAVKVAGGQSKVTFTVATSPVASRTNVKITAWLDEVSKDATLAVMPYNPADLNGDGYSDLVLQNQADRRIALLTLSGQKVISSTSTSPTLPENWRVAGVGDFDQDSRNDIVVQNSATRAVSVLIMNGSTVQSSVGVYPTLPANWQVMAVADVDNNGRPDLIVQNLAMQQVSILVMEGTKIKASMGLSQNLAPNWKVVGAADLNGDGLADLVVQNPGTRQISILTLNGTKITGSVPVYPTLPENWAVGGVGDYNGDGKADLVVQNSVTRQVSVLTLVNMKITASLPITPAPLEGWKLVGPK